MDLTAAALLGAAAAVAGAINSVAGGGTLVSFPAAMAFGLPPLTANATNAVALAPAQLASAWAYRRELRQDRRVVRLLAAPSLIGGAAGSALLLLTPQRVFADAVPFLLLLAALLLLWQNLRPLAPDEPPGAPPSPGAPPVYEGWRLPKRTAWVMLLQLLVGVYGGYFGAGMGIMMLAIFSMLAGSATIHRLNAVKALLAAGINGIAAVAFLWARAVDLEALPIMAVGAVIGAWGGATLARRVNPRAIRWLVVALGVLIAAQQAWQRFGP